MNTITASNAYVQQVYLAASTHPANHAETSKTFQHEDTVHLSSAAKAALSDVDHGGDSH